jgi:Uma2 family endonuclease
MVLQVSPTATADDIIYPDCDGEPVANNTEQFEIIVLIKGNLDILFAQDPNVFIAGDLFWYPISGNNTVKYAPDVMVALGRPKGKRYSYKQWEEGNQPPQVVFEILSPSNTPREMTRKLLFYDHHGVEEYYLYDPAISELSVWLRGDLGLDLIDIEQTWTSPRLGIRFDISNSELALYYPNGQPFLSFLELEQRAETAEQRAETAEQRAETAEQRAKQIQEALHQAVRQLLGMEMSVEQVAAALTLPVAAVVAIASSPEAASPASPPPHP